MNQMDWILACARMTEEQRFMPSCWRKPASSGGIFLILVQQIRDESNELDSGMRQNDGRGKSSSCWRRPASSGGIFLILVQQIRDESNELDSGMRQNDGRTTFYAVMLAEASIQWRNLLYIDASVQGILEWTGFRHAPE